MEINNAALAGFRTKFSTLFNSAYQLAQPILDKVAVVVDSGMVETVNHRWMRGIPGMREFIGDRVINNLDTDGMIIKNKTWEDTVAILRPELERDQFGVYEPSMTRLGEVAKLHRDELGFPILSAALAAATRASYLAYDGAAFFGTHSLKRTVAFTNLGSDPLTEPALAAAISNIRARKDSAGHSLAAMGTKLILLHPPGLQQTANKLANSSWIVSTQPGTGIGSASNPAGASENTLKGLFEPELAVYLSTDTEWHLCLQHPLYRPLVFQKEKEIEIYGWDKFLQLWIMRDQAVFGAYGRYNVGLGLPESVFSSTGLGS